MPRGRKKKVQDNVDFFKTVESIIGRPLLAKETTTLAQAARNFIRDNFLVTDVYPAEIIEEAVNGSTAEKDDWDIDADEEDNGCHGAGHSDLDYYGRSEYE